MHFNIKYIYWVTHAIATIADEHPQRYQSTLETLKRETIAKGRHVLLTTDPAAAKLTGEGLQKKLQEANEETAQAAYQEAMKCLGSLVETGSLQIRLNF